ncbi:MAG TPA: energy transducer TonB [Bryobacteraceae bacterium]|nr:energy transducer TonB [Bryobacteraceae bacterium]HOL71567.1 energy transducer TonB [Bryobacteraceae bacterium]HOQ44287.1 energy transducer TonB [Bryobacteraceae bacterium]HPQ17197.1 energy transducer TonB [Bryobacteraceae bacterium]HPU70605.1 energy transducer TonB [Bryobacteraceae bacterium]
MKNLPSKVLTLVAFAAVCLLFAGQAAMAAERIPAATALAAVASKVTPEMPPLAKQLKLSGLVEMDVTINEEGDVEKVTVLRGNPILSRAAEDTMKKWKFKPIKQGDKAIKAITTLTFEFKYKE